MDLDNTPVPNFANLMRLDGQVFTVLGAGQILTADGGVSIQSPPPVSPW